MKNRTGIILLVVVCVGLVIALVITQTQSARREQESASTISTLSNKWSETESRLEDARGVNTALTNEVVGRDKNLVEMTNRLAETTLALNQSEQALKAAQEEVAKKDKQISDLQTQKEELDQHAADLSVAITNLQTQIDATQQKLAAAEGDKAFLQKELARLTAEKADLERKFNDLKVLRAQVAKLKAELSVSRRLEWIREGLFSRSEQKGAQRLMEGKAPVGSPPGATESKPRAAYDLNVEVNADGTVRVIPPPTNSPAGSNAPPAK